MNKKLIFAMVGLATLIGSASAADRPQIKEGLWQIRTQTIDNPSNKKTEGTVMLCRDHDFDKSAEALAKNVKGCTTISESFAAGKFSSETRCEVASTVIDSKGTVTFQSDTAAHSETHVTYTPALYGNADETMIQDQTYLGDCPAGMQPGDRKSQDGTIVHLRKH
jgi:hypothetical protein